PPSLPKALDARLQMRLILLGHVVLGVLAQVPQLARGKEAGGDLATPGGFEVLEFAFECDQSSWRDRLTVCHGASSSHGEAFYPGDDLWPPHRAGAVVGEERTPAPTPKPQAHGLRNEDGRLSRACARATRAR